MAQLCSQLDACLSVEDVEATTNLLDPSSLSGNNDQVESMIWQMQSAREHGNLTELILASAFSQAAENIVIMS